MSKEHSYAYEAGYRDGAINYELDHCPACKNVADLQEVLDENAELRELVKHLRECTRHNTCAVCEYADDACDFDYDMRKLGVEVD